MNPYYSDRWVTIYCGDCREILPQLKGTGIVTDPPYELGFMGKSWDSQGVSFQKQTWQVIRGSCVSGSMLLSFGGTRTFHRIACAIEDAGWELRDTVMWVYGSGFPKSLDISKAIDKQFGVDREIVGKRTDIHSHGTPNRIEHEWNKTLKDNCHVTLPATPEAQLWQGYGTALKPAYEPILVCMNPLDGTFANNALKHGVAGLNIDGCRIPTEESLSGGSVTSDRKAPMTGDSRIGAALGMFAQGSKRKEEWIQPLGRFPANIIHDGSEEVLGLFPQSAGQQGDLIGHNKQRKSPNDIFGVMPPAADHIKRGDSGSAARFFYCAKASKSERNAGCEGLPLVEVKTHGEMNPDSLGNSHNTTGQRPALRQNNHPTVKPLALMKYLVKLISPPKDAVIIDPFMGSGSTLVACKELGIKCIGIDTDEYTCEIAVKRCQATKRCSQEVMELCVT